MAAKAEVEPQAIVVGIDPSQFPSAPKAAASRRSKKREAKQRLLDADAAALEAVVE